MLKRTLYGRASFDLLHAHSTPLERVVARRVRKNQGSISIDTNLDLGTGDNGLTLAIKARQRRPKLRVSYEPGCPESLIGRAFFLGEQVFYKPFNRVALKALVSALRSSRRQ